MGQHPFPVKKMPLRELPNEAQNFITRSPSASQLSKDRAPPGSSPLSRDTGLTTVLPGGSPLSRDAGPTSDAAKLLGTKRKQTDSPSSASGLHPSSNSGANGHLVYVRRRLETEPDFKVPKAQQELNQEPKYTSAVPAAATVSYPPNPSGELPRQGLAGKPLAGLSENECDSAVTNRIPLRGEPQSSEIPDWKERFLRLQMFLKSCDQSSQGDYIQKLRSLSAAGRSRHAVELEKRAIQLLVEEGIELHRMKALNVLGKPLPSDNTAPLAQTPSPLHAQFERGDRQTDAAKLTFSRNG